MHALRTLALLAVAAGLAPLAWAGTAQGDLASDSPVQLFGSGTVDGALTLYHYAFADGSLTGTSYNGRLINYTHLTVPNRPNQHYGCREQYDGQESEEILFNVNVSKPDEHTQFKLLKGSLARLEAPRGLPFRTPASSVEPAEAEPFAYLGPNPYLYQEVQTIKDERPDKRLAPAFPTSTFLALPNGALHTDGGHTMEVHWGNLTYSRLGTTKTIPAGEFVDRRSLNSDFLSNPLSEPADCKVLVTSILYFDQELSTVAIDQSGLARATSYYAGHAQLGDPLQPHEPAPPFGHWTRAKAPRFEAALEAYRLPATTIGGQDFHVVGVARAHFPRALGSALFDNQLHEANDETVILTGDLDLQPTFADTGGHRMRTHIGGEATDFATRAPSKSLAWIPYAWGAAGGVAFLGFAYFAWPAVKFGATKFMLFPLYARLRKEDILENPLRDDILDVVDREPGISASELGRRLSCGWGTLVYHLTVLERMQLLSSAREGRHKRFFVQGRINYSDKGAVGLLANPAARTLLLAIQEHPGVIQKELARMLGLTSGTISWHVERLSSAGLVVKEEDGRAVRYYPAQKLAELTRQLGA